MSKDSGTPRDRPGEKFEGEWGTQPLAACVREAVRRYLAELNGHPASQLHNLVISQVEPALLEVVMEHVSGNITRAADMLGLNRATLRKKLQKYGLDK